MATAAVLLAAGSGSRLRGGDNKVFAPVEGIPLIAWSIRAFTSCDAIDQLVVVTRAGDRERMAAIIAGEAVTVPLRTAVGGQTRSDSERSGLEALAGDIDDGTIDVVLVHDAARPLVSHRLIADVVDAARTIGGAVPTLPVDDVVYRSAPDGRTLNEVDTRGGLHRAQTPQGFSARDLLAAYRRATRDDFHGVDTAATVERYTDLEVAAVPGEQTNIKVTYAEDLVTAQRIAGALRT